MIENKKTRYINYDILINFMMLNIFFITCMIIIYLKTILLTINLIKKKCVSKFISKKHSLNSINFYIISFRMILNILIYIFPAIFSVYKFISNSNIVFI